MYQCISGLEDTFHLLTEAIGWHHEYHAIRQQLHVYNSSGILLHGPAGCGKTLLVQKIAAEMRASLHTVVASSVFDAVTGHSEQRLRHAFKTAQRDAEMQPVILFLDEVDALCPKRMPGEEHEMRVVAQLLTLLDGVCQWTGAGRQLLVIAASNRPEAIDPALRRAGRLDREVHIPLPTKQARQAILAFHTATMPLAPDCDLADIAVASQGYSSSDLVALCREASIAAIARNVLAAHDDDGLEPGQDIINKADFISARSQVKSSLDRSNIVELHGGAWDQIGGLTDAKERLMKGIVWPIQHGNALERLGLGAPKGIIIEGPPGCAKTTLMQAAMRASGALSQVLTPAQLYSSFVGEGEASLRAAFSTARSSAPSIIVIDELDTVAGSRSGDSVGTTQLLTSLLTEIDGLENAPGVLVLAATNRPEAIDAALLRPGRFDVSIKISQPDAASRLEILKVYCRDYKLSTQIDLKAISERMHGYSGADIECVCREAVMAALPQQIISTSYQCTQTVVIEAQHINEAMLLYNN